MVVHQHRSSHGCRVAVNCPAHRSTMTPPQSRKVNWWLKICHASISWPCTVVMRAIFHEHPYRPMSPLNWHVSKIFIVSEHIRYIRESLSFCFVFVRVTEFETNKKCFSLSLSHTQCVRYWSRSRSTISHCRPNEITILNVSRWAHGHRHASPGGSMALNTRNVPKRWVRTTDKKKMHSKIDGRRLAPWEFVLFAT